MEEIKDINGIVVKAGDTIQMPHFEEEGYKVDKNRMYKTKVSYNEKRDCLVDDNGMGFRFAYGVEVISGKLNV